MPKELEIGERVQAGCLVIEATGEFTRFQYTRFINAVRRGIKPGISRVIIDLGRLDHMSASSLAELAETYQILADAGCQLVLACPGPQVRKLLVLSFLDKLIGTADSVEAAVSRQ